jgi:hypothetical protein
MNSKLGCLAPAAMLVAPLWGPAPAQARVSGDTIRIGLITGRAREWFDRQGLDMLIGGANPGASPAMAKFQTMRSPEVSPAIMHTASLYNGSREPRRVQ